MQKIKNIYHLIRAVIAQIWYGYPGRKLKVIGVTGTDGKTTTTHLIYHILTHAGKKASMISTIFAKVGQNVYDTGFHVTTPDAFLIPKYLHMASVSGQEYFVLETTSHRLDQNQLFGLHFYIGVITNITHEHLDYHHTYKEYVQSKLRLLDNSDIGIINKDDSSYEYIKAQDPRFSERITYGIHSDADFKEDFRDIISNLAEFNAANYLAAYVVCSKIGIPRKTILEAFKTFSLPPGRIDVVYDGDFKVIVDFAHTPNAVYKILETVRKQYLKANGKIIHVFGSAGLRDATKRFSMGVSSASFADKIILTEEDYRTENPVDICNQIGAGIQNKGKSYTVIIERDKAIRQAIQKAKKNDIVIITGKGHEKSLCRGTVEYPWNDLEAVKKILKI